ncbi:MAG TPA: hypothetical protein VE934_09185 [Polaromonas sp.]|uniref:hypothetical protein n=1 Tax=Polaromonas sp. TaxID=1869339 RepID=UPI002D37B4A2|nr:hypothetical protein [Polaromonas sp.]HYW57123.1 hypothetical protein [Polaromonas sp.]
MNTPYQRLTECADITELRPRLHALCSSFGSLSRLDILPATQAGKRQALCFLRMDTAEQERRLMNELGVGRFGGDLVVVVDLKAGDANNSTFRPSSSRNPAPQERALSQ